MRFVGAALALCLVLTGCGGGSSSKEPVPPKKATTAKTLTTRTVAPTNAAPTGTPAPEDLSNFLCAPDAEGVWSASGILKNESPKAATYQVTVFVGVANAKDSLARTKEFPSVGPGGSIRVQLTKIPAAKAAAQCYVQVLRRP